MATAKPARDNAVGVSVNKAKMPREEIPENSICEYVNDLRSRDPERWSRAASQLVDLGTNKRGSDGPRGSVAFPAEIRLGTSALPEYLELHLRDADIFVRKEVVSALGEWGDGRVAKVLIDHFDRESDETLRVTYLLAIRTIGGLEAVTFLAQIAATDHSESVRFAAAAALEELAAGGWQDMSDREEPGPRRRPDNPSLSAAVKALARLSEDETQAGYLRNKARTALGYLLAA